MDEMNRPLRTPVGRPLRVLLVGDAGPANVALSAWLGEREMLEVAGPVATTAEALALAASFKPDVTLLDFHGLPASTGYTVSLFKGLSPPPLVFVLTHDASETMRRRCNEARVDAVFDKTTELETVATVLEQTRESFAALPAYQAIRVEA
jgi:DNA-binding NarL/FixJ family response regulator